VAEVVANLFETGIYAAVAKAGGVSEVAKKLGVSRQVVYVWLRRGFAPPIRAIQLEEMYRVPRAKLMDPLLLRGSLAEVVTRSDGALPYRPKGSVRDLV
jgi:hypothetical protein